MARSQGSEVGPVLVAGLQGLLDQQAPKARAVDEEVALDHLAAFQRHRAHEAVGLAQRGRQDLALGADHAQALGVGAQMASVEGGVELEGVGQRFGRRARPADRPVEASGESRLGVQRIVPQPMVVALGAARQPVVVERHDAQRPSDLAEGVDVVVTRRAPAHELYAQLDRALRGLEEGVLVQAQEGVDVADLGMVASPTPTMPISSDSTRRTRTVSPRARASTAALIQPAVPPPTTTTDLILLSAMPCVSFLTALPVGRVRFARSKRNPAGMQAPAGRSQGRCRQKRYETPTM